MSIQCELWALVSIILLTTPVGLAVSTRGIYGQVSPQPVTWRVPALYVFGDSTVDNGNNNQLATYSRSNYPPYGRDFDTGLSTGRFTNGKTSSDWLCQFLRLPIGPPYLSPEARMYRFQGANFASAGAGILNRTGNVLGQILSGWQQIELFVQKRNALIEELGEPAVTRHLATSLFYFATGGNDFIHNWIINDTDSMNLPLTEFSSLLAATFRAQLQVLYDAGARKAAVLGIGPVGCAPHFLWLSRTATAQCIETANQIISEFNDVLRFMLVRFNERNKGAHFEYRDIFDIVYRLAKSPAEYGFQNGNTACCGAGFYGGAQTCWNILLVCQTPPDYVWWDEYHPSHRANYIVARQIFSGVDPSTTTWNFTSNANYTFLTVEQLASLELDEED